MADLGEKLDEMEGLADKSFSLFGLRFTPTQLGMAVAAVGSVLGALYGGFTMYQKVEELASLDIGAYQAQMEQTSAKIETQEKLLTSIESNLRDAKVLIYDVEKRVNDRVTYFEGKMMSFEAKVEKTKADLEDRIQKSLDNPLTELQ